MTEIIFACGKFDSATRPRRISLIHVALKSRGSNIARFTHPGWNSAIQIAACRTQVEDESLNTDYIPRVYVLRTGWLRYSNPNASACLSRLAAASQLAAHTSLPSAFLRCSFPLCPLPVIIIRCIPSWPWLLRSVAIEVEI